MLIYKAPSRTIPPKDVLMALDQSPDMFGTPPVVQVSGVMVVGVTMRRVPKNTIVEAVVAPIRSYGGLVKTLSLTHMVPAPSVVRSGERINDSYARIAAIAKDSPEQRSDPLGIKRVAAAAGAGLTSVLRTAKWVSVGVIGIVLLVVLWPMIKEARGGR